MLCTLNSPLVLVLFVHLVIRRVAWPHSGPLGGGILLDSIVGQLEGGWGVGGGGVVGLPQTPLAQLLFLPGQFQLIT